MLRENHIMFIPYSTTYIFFSKAGRRPPRTATTYIVVIVVEIGIRLVKL